MTTSSDGSIEAVIATAARDAIRCLAAAERAVEEGRLNVAKLLRAQALAARQRALMLERVVARGELSIDVVRVLSADAGRSAAALDGAAADLGDASGVVIRNLRASNVLLDKTLTALERDRDVPETVLAQFLWGCNDCGFIVEGARAEVCPSCGSMGGDFEMFAPFFSSTTERIARKQPQEIAATLREDPERFAASLGSAHDDLLRRSPGEGEWCIKEIAGHMIDIAEIFVRRVQPVVDATVADVDEGIVLPWKVLDGKGYAEMTGRALVERFAEVTAEALGIIGQLSDAHWRSRTRWVIGTVTVIDTASWLVNHNVAHLQQILARREEFERTTA